MITLRALACLLPVLPSMASAYNYSASPESLQRQFISTLADRPKNCPPCFNCLLPAFDCQQFSDCRSYDGKCDCKPGFGGDDCSQPLCGALSDGKDRYPREEQYCKCKDGWDGINCNLCTNDGACAPLMPEGVEGVCYKGGITVKENYQMCDVTNRKILEELKQDRPQVTFSCKKEEAACEFQFWVEHDESFYCALDHCTFGTETAAKSNITHYDCANIKCKCVPDKLLCGKGTGIDLTDFLTEEIKGPATFSCKSSKGNSDKCEFSEPHMNDLISGAFGDETITLNCNAAECLAKTQVPGWKPPKHGINKSAIAGAIAGSSLLLLILALGVWYLHRRSQMKSGLGAIHLPLDGDESGKLITEHRPASLHFEDVSYTINGRVILSGVHGAVNPGQVMAIMGASGAGKTTFLDILARKNKRGTVTGNILVNGLKVSDDEFRNVIGFVDQEDTMMPTLTVYETVLNSALLRLPRDMDYGSKEKRVSEVMQQLGIYAIKDQLIGSQEGERGISGGEKRRVGIACELVTSPAILFLDEPTSGLDSFNAYNVVECLVNLAQNYNRTIIFTIHQPRSNIVALFDRLVLLARGKMVYSGEYRSCQRYFTDIGYPCPPGFNIADYLVDLTMHANRTRSEDATPTHSADDSSDETATAAPSRIVGRKRGDSVRDRQERALFTRQSSLLAQDGEAVPLTDVNEATSEWATQAHHELLTQRQENEDDAELLPILENGTTELDTLIEAYINSDISKSVHDEIQVVSANGQNGTLESVIGTGPVKGFTRIGWWSQFAILSSRTWKNLYRNPMLMLTHYVIAIILAVLCGFLFYHVTDDIRGFQNRMGLFFFVLALFGFSTLTSLTVFSQERLLFVRERANGYYSPITYFSAKVIFDIVPLRIFPPMILGAIVYPMVGLIPEWPAFFKFVLVLVLFNFSAATICLFIGIVLKDTGLANLVGSLVMLFSLLMAGLLLNHDSIPVVAQWLQRISIFHYGFEALIVNEVRYITLIDHKYGLDIEVPGATILTTFGFDNLAYWDDVRGLAIFAGSFIVLAYAGMHFLLVEKR